MEQTVALIKPGLSAEQKSIYEITGLQGVLYSFYYIYKELNNKNDN